MPAYTVSCLNNNSFIPQISYQTVIKFGCKSNYFYKIIFHHFVIFYCRRKKIFWIMDSAFFYIQKNAFKMNTQNFCHIICLFCCSMFNNLNLVFYVHDIVGYKCRINSANSVFSDFFCQIQYLFNVSFIKINTECTMTMLVY